jgi:hypothetical protein
VQAHVFCKLYRRSVLDRAAAAQKRGARSPKKLISNLSALRDELKQQGKKGALKVPFARCVLGMGCVDEHDCLEPDEVLVNDGRGCSERTPVLVGRSPAYHPGDLRVLYAVPKPEALIQAGVSRRGSVMFSTRCAPFHESLMVWSCINVNVASINQGEPACV